MKISAQFNKIWLAAAVMRAWLLSSCGSAQNVASIQDIQPNAMLALREAKPITLEPGDKLSIIIHSRDEELAKMFNIDGSAYTIGSDGKIDMPILGPITAEGLTRVDLANLIKYKLLTANLLRDPVVTVEFFNMSFSVLGEVNSPGRQSIDRDQITLLEALAQAGDLTIGGKRENIIVLRTENGRQIPYRVDLTNTASVYGSPAYYIKQNDVIYVEPTMARANQATATGNSVLTPQFWVSILSMVTTVVLFLTK